MGVRALRIAAIAFAGAMALAGCKQSEEGREYGGSGTAGTSEKAEKKAADEKAAEEKSLGQQPSETTGTSSGTTSEEQGTGGSSNLGAPSQSGDVSGTPPPSPGQEPQTPPADLTPEQEKELQEQQRQQNQ